MTNTSTQIPTAWDLFQEEGYTSVHRVVDDSWRHGSVVFQVWQREEDGTFWGSRYYVTPDGDTNTLRDGLAKISQYSSETQILPVTTYMEITLSPEGTAAVDPIAPSQDRNP